MASCSSDGLVIEACAKGLELCELIGELRKRGHEKEFLTKIFEKRSVAHRTRTYCTRTACTQDDWPAWCWSASPSPYPITLTLTLTLTLTRDKQLFPRDLLVAYVPTRRGGLRAAGILKRSLKFDARRGSHICIDFVWVLSDFRRQGVGRRLLMDG